MRIGLFHPVLHHHPLGDLRSVFDAWLREPGISAATAPETSWHALLQPVIGAMRAVVRDRRSLGLILSTTKGDIEREVAWLRSEATGNLATLGNAAATLAEALGISGPVWVVSTACSSGLVALMDAAIAVRQGEADAFLVIAADLASAFVRDGFSALKAISPTHTCRPFDQQRDGLMLGSAAAACIVGPIAEEGPPPFAEIRGFGISNDATHMTAPDRQARGLSRTIRAALDLAGLSSKDVDAALLHGTGTRYNDAMEALAIETVFGNAPRLPITAVKGLIGHTLGASGLVETLLAAEMLRRQVLPPIIHLRQPERDDLHLVRTPTPAALRTILKTASGFGGMNAALLLSPGAANA